MDTTDTLEIQIAKARENLTEMSRGAIDAVDWKSIIAGMNSKFNSDQLENLEIETELLLCGLIDTEEYQKELELKMRLHPSDSMSLINELDKLIFKKIQEGLEKRLSGEIKSTPIKKQVIIDPRFTNVPKNVGEAIALSNWKEKLYEIAQKYNLPIDKMGALEEITIKTITGEIKTENYESEVKLQINVPQDKIKDFIAEINEVVFKRIQEIMRSGGSIKKDVKIPLPPYKSIKKEEPTLPADKLPVPGNNENVNTTINDKLPIDDKNISQNIISADTPPAPIMKTEEIVLNKIKEGESAQDAINNILAIKTNSLESDIYREHGIEIIPENSTSMPEIKKDTITTEEKPITQNNINSAQAADETTNKIIDQKIINPLNPNIISDKLFNKTVSQATVVDYSLPKITTQSDQLTQKQDNTSPHDPYHEQI